MSPCEEWAVVGDPQTTSILGPGLLWEPASVSLGGWGGDKERLTWMGRWVELLFVPCIMMTLEERRSHSSYFWGGRSKV